MDTARKLVPELLDWLPSDNPRAIRSRLDLTRVNALMGNAGVVAKEVLRDCKSPITSILDVGSGDGLFMLSLARRLAHRMPRVRLTTVDQQDLITQETCKQFELLGWEVNPVSADVHVFLEGYDRAPVDLVTANLFLHHFDAKLLASLLELISLTSPRFIACEPARTTIALAASRLLGAIGCNDVTRHDAVASVVAGFSGNELSEQWPGSGCWSVRESRAGLFSHLFSAQRTG